ncbi:hypothetical protein GCM10008020_25030 [Massilia psychrophila]|nr:hypothetical protein GCM10008020_25030 [Massilia psychrophila]
MRAGTKRYSLWLGDQRLIRAEQSGPRGRVRIKLPRAGADNEAEEASYGWVHDPTSLDIYAVSSGTLYCSGSVVLPNRVNSPLTPPPRAGKSLPPDGLVGWMQNPHPTLSP